MADVKKIDTVEVEITANTDSFDENVAKLPDKLKETVNKLNAIKDAAEIKVFINNKQVTKALQNAIPKVEIPTDIIDGNLEKTKSENSLGEDAKQFGATELAKQQKALQDTLQKTNQEYSKLIENQKKLASTAKGDVTQNLKYQEISGKLQQLDKVKDQLNTDLDKAMKANTPSIDNDALKQVKDLEQNISTLAKNNPTMKVDVDSSSANKTLEETSNKLMKLRERVKELFKGIEFMPAMKDLGGFNQAVKTTVDDLKTKLSSNKFKVNLDVDFNKSPDPAFENSLHRLTRMAEGSIHAITLLGKVKKRTAEQNYELAEAQSKLAASTSKLDNLKKAATKSFASGDLTFEKYNNRLKAIDGTTQKLNQTKQTAKKIIKGKVTSWGRLGSELDKTSKSQTRVNAVIGRGGRQADNAGKSMGFLARRLRLVLTNWLLFRPLMNLLQGFSNHLFGALNANTQFATSLNSIKANLQTAFYPIYTAVLPALNALMQAIQVVTQELARFISMLTGITFKQAQSGAQGLATGMGQVENNANGAKDAIAELERSLMGFDEINQLDDPTSNMNTGSGGAGGGAGGNGVDWGLVSELEVPAWLKRFQDLMADFFKPFQKAWETQGASVMEAWQYALEEVIGLVKVIGESFMEVWTNGTGELFLGNILMLVTNVLNIVGDLASAFRVAWIEGDRGTALVQSLFNYWNAVLGLLNAIAVAFREAWNDGTGVSIASSILEIFTNILNVKAELINRIKEAWEESLAGERIMRAILGIVDDILKRINNVTEATVDWAKELDFTPLLESIATLLEHIKPLSDTIGEGLEWFYINVLLPLAEFTITHIIPVFLDTLSSAVGLLTTVIDVLKPLALWFWEDWLQPIASWTGGAIVSILESLGTTLDRLSGFIQRNQDVIVAILKPITLFIAGFVALKAAVAVVLGVLAKFKAIVLAVKAAILIITAPITLKIAAITALTYVVVNLYKIIKDVDWLALGNSIIEGIKNGIASAMRAIKNWIKKWVVDPIVNAFKSLFRINSPSKVFEEFGGFLMQGLLNGIGAAVDLVANIWKGIKDTAGKIWGSTKDLASNIWGATGGAIISTMSDARDSAKERFTSMRDNAKERFTSIKDNSKEQFNKVKDNITGSLSTARDKAKDRFTTIRDNGRDRFTSLRDNSKDRFTSLRDNATDRLTELRNTSKERFTSVRDDGTDRLTTLRNNSRDRFTTIRDNGTERLTTLRANSRDRFNDIRDNATDRLNTLRDRSRDRFTSIRDTGTDRLTTLRDRSRDRFTDMRDTANTRLTTMRNTVTDRFTSMRDNGTSRMTTLRDNVRSRFKDMKDDADKTGESMNDGFKEGLDRGTGGVLSAVGGWATSITNTAKSNLKINSPSRVFKEIGEFTGQGFIVGLPKYFEPAVDLVEGYADEIISCMQDITDEFDLSNHEITLPDLFKEPSANLHVSAKGALDIGTNEMNATLLQILNTLQQQQDPQVDANLYLDGRQIVTHVVSDINRQTRQSGVSPLLT